MAEFSARHGPEFIEWEKHSNYLCCLELSEFKMKVLLTKLKDLEIKHVVFLEPDIGNEMTCITIECLSEETQKNYLKTLN